MNRITQIGSFEQTIRSSRFIGVCGPAKDEAAARAFIQQNGAPGCRHVCFAYRCAEIIRFDDAGEPGGTAGRPMLAALNHHQLDFSVVVVSRFFGGVKLGKGGLARAYGGTAMQAIADAKIEPIIETVFSVAGCRSIRPAMYISLPSAMRLKNVARNGMSGLRLEVEISRERADGFVAELIAMTHGEASVKKTG